MDVEQCNSAESTPAAATTKAATSSSSASSSPSPRSPQMMPKKKSTSKTESRLRSKSNCDELSFVDCVLETKDLWDKFHDLETEMIITKTGR